jgi:hypothetical protein
VQRQQFLGPVALALKTPGHSFAKLTLPLGIILLGKAAQVIGQFQPLIRLEAIHRVLKLGYAHGVK